MICSGADEAKVVLWRRAKAAAPVQVLNIHGRVTRFPAKAQTQLRSKAAPPTAQTRQRLASSKVRNALATQVVAQITFKLLPKDAGGDMSDAYTEDWELQVR